MIKNKRGTLKQQHIKYEGTYVFLLYQVEKDDDDGDDDDDDNDDDVDKDNAAADNNDDTDDDGDGTQTNLLYSMESGDMSSRRVCGSNSRFPASYSSSTKSPGGIYSSKKNEQK
ncbi:hypothetical protein ElyMa_000591000 [Elysia marginata]|uniref:Uncharacterized protein n=1 Tax=Elysia marginata TaxID=1093978 RepID=A0AAV4G6I1_9GAST|nr:hypothetical protein ElyMa_000591000 [Elysia marginata]